MSNQLREYKASIEGVLADYGITHFRYEQASKHMKCIFTLPNGRERFTLFPKTGGDHRGMMNQARDVRRELRGCGVEPLRKKA